MALIQTLKNRHSRSLALFFCLAALLVFAVAFLFINSNNSLTKKNNVEISQQKAESHTVVLGSSIVPFVEGEDYSLPDTVESEDFSGYVCGNCDNSVSGSMWLGWNDFEPERGVYDWTVLENSLNNLAAQGKTGSLHLQSITTGGYNPDNGISVSREVPEWIFTYYDLDPEDLPTVGGAFSIIVIPQWQTEIGSDFNNMIRALGEAYADDPRLESIYLHGISESRGEELWMTQPYLNTIEADWGLTPTVMYDWLSARMDAYTEAFAGVEYKVAWVGMGPSWFQGRTDFEGASTNLLYYAWSKGFGNRNGGIEFYFWHIEQTSWGSTVDDDGYIIIDEDSPNFDGRYWGEENEEYGEAWEWRYGSKHSDPYRYRMSVMRALQARMRWLWTSEAGEEINPGLSEYARLSFGKDVYNSPDAWALLFESPISSYGVDQVRNFERWLLQRDITGGVTVPSLFYYFDAGAGSYTHYTARRTDIATGNNYIYFALDDNFVADDTVQIKVEMIDNAQTDWHLEYYNNGGVLASTTTISNSNDDQIKTYTITIHDANFANQFDSDMDFRLVNDGPGDLT
ncbi:hypothetical protein KJ810_01615, partial [Patescibacteria group bacterium]|nr:hypothetical protein [Patescibacteria group bacterium]